MPTPPTNASTAGPNRAPSTAGSRASAPCPPTRHDLHPQLQAADRHRATAPRQSSRLPRRPPKLVSEALATAREAGGTGLRILRADSQFHNSRVIGACRRADARFSITCGMNPSIKRTIAAVPDTAWQQITYPTAVPDPETGELIFDAEVAEIPAYTAFASRKKSERVTARLIVRRVRDLAKPATVGEQGELFPVWRYHPIFTDNPAPMLQAEREHRHHAVIEQVIADSKASALAHLPSGHFNANAAWITLWAMAYHLLRATGARTAAGRIDARNHVYRIGGDHRARPQRVHRHTLLAEFRGQAERDAAEALDVRGQHRRALVDVRLRVERPVEHLK